MTQTQKDRDALREWAVFYESDFAAKIPTSI